MTDIKEYKVEGYNENGLTDLNSNCPYGNNLSLKEEYAICSNENFAAANENFDAIETNTQALKTGLEYWANNVTEEFNKTNQQISNVSSDFNTFKNNTKGKINEFDVLINGNGETDGLIKKTSALETNLSILNNTIISVNATLQEKMDDLDFIINGNAKTDGLVNRTSDLETGLTNLTNFTENLYNETTNNITLLNKKFDDLNNVTSQLNNIINNSTIGIIHNISLLRNETEGNFSTINTNINNVNKTLTANITDLYNEINDEENGIKTKIDNINKEIVKINETIYNETNGIIKNITLLRNETEGNFSTLFGNFSTINTNINNVNKTLTANITDLYNEINDENNGIKARLTKIEKKLKDPNNISNEQLEQITQNIINSESFQNTINNMFNRNIVEAMNTACSKAVQDITGQSTETCNITQETFQQNLQKYNNNKAKAVAKTMQDTINKTNGINNLAEYADFNYTTTLKTSEESGKQFRTTNIALIAALSVLACGTAAYIGGRGWRLFKKGRKLLENRDSSEEAKKIMEKSGIGNLIEFKNPGKDKNSLKPLFDIYSSNTNEIIKEINNTEEYKNLNKSYEDNKKQKDEELEEYKKQLKQFNIFSRKFSKKAKNIKNKIEDCEKIIKELEDLKTRVDTCIEKHAYSHFKQIMRIALSKLFATQAEQMRLEEHRKQEEERMFKEIREKLKTFTIPNKIEIQQPKNMSDTLEQLDETFDNARLKVADQNFSKDCEDIQEDSKQNYEAMTKKQQKKFETRGAKEEEHGKSTPKSKVLIANRNEAEQAEQKKQTKQTKQIQNVKQNNSPSWADKFKGNNGQQNDKENVRE